MEKQLMIYERAVPVSKERHRGLSVRAGHDYGFASDLNGVPLLAAEFENALREYPIVFSAVNGGCTPAALVGLQNGENLFVKADHGWDAKYIPAFIRRYPFVFSKAPDGDTFTLCIDEGFSGCNRDGEGDALFDEAGEVSDYLRRMMGFTTTYQREFQVTRTFCDTLSALDVLTPRELKFPSEDGKKAVTGGFLTVNRERLKALPAKKLSALTKSGDLEKIYAHLLSLGNADALSSRLSEPSIGPG